MDICWSDHKHFLRIFSMKVTVSGAKGKKKKSYNFACPLGAREIKGNSWYNGICNIHKLNITQRSVRDLVIRESFLKKVSY